MAVLMPTKIKSLRERDPGVSVTERLHFAGLETLLVSGEVDRLGEQLALLDTVNSYSGGIGEALDIIRYHLWRKGILDETLGPAQKKLLEILCFEKVPAKVLMGKSPRTDPHFHYNGSVSRIRAMHFALALLEDVSSGTSDYAWSNFSGLDYSLYRPYWNEKTEFFYHAALVVAARTRNWSEEARWKLMALFQTDPPESPRAKPIRTFTLFAGTAYLSEDEIKRRGRDFALKFPGDGWTFIGMAQLAKHYGDESLAEFGLTEASRYVEADPKLKEELERLTKALNP